MKAITLTLFSLVSFVALSFAQQKAAVKMVINTPTVQCEVCKDKLEAYLKREPGILAVKVDIKKKITTVSFLTDRNNLEQIKTAIANAGFDADDISAEEETIKKLPICCQRPIIKKPKPVSN